MHRTNQWKMKKNRLNPAKEKMKRTKHDLKQKHRIEMQEKEPKTCLGIHMSTEMEGEDGEERRFMWL